MIDKQQNEMNESATENGIEELHYEEPPAMTAKDSVGVAVAIVALAVIGYLGYLWLTPGMSITEMFKTPEATAVSLDTIEVEPETKPNSDSDAVEAEPIRCPTCGMYPEKSASHVVMNWSDGTSTNHDCWDCAFYHGIDEGLTFTSAEVTLNSGSVDDPQWIDAEAAWYLYDTDKSVEGSMPPFVVAFESMEAAHANHGEWGGEVVDFAGLQSKWQ